MVAAETSGWSTADDCQLLTHTFKLNTTIGAVDRMTAVTAVLQGEADHGADGKTWLFESVFCVRRILTRFSFLLGFCSVGFKSRWKRGYCYSISDFAVEGCCFDICRVFQNFE